MFLLIILIRDIKYKDKYAKFCMLYNNNHSFSQKQVLKLCNNNSFSYYSQKNIKKKKEKNS